MDDVSVKTPDNTEPLAGHFRLCYGQGYGGWECWIAGASLDERVIGNTSCNPKPGETPREAAWRVLQPELKRLRDHHADCSRRFAQALDAGLGPEPQPAWLKRA
jgi:hypothetical protein